MNTPTARFQAAAAALAEYNALTTQCPELACPTTAKILSDEFMQAKRNL